MNRATLPVPSALPLFPALPARVLKTTVWACPNKALPKSPHAAARPNIIRRVDCISSSPFLTWHNCFRRSGFNGSMIAPIAVFANRRLRTDVGERRPYKTARL